MKARVGGWLEVYCNKKEGHFNDVLFALAFFSKYLSRTLAHHFPHLFFPFFRSSFFLSFFLPSLAILRFLHTTPLFNFLFN